MRHKILSGAEIRKIRIVELNNMPQETLADMADTTRRTVIKYETGQTRPKGWFLKRLDEIRREYKSKPVLIQLHQFTDGCKKRLALIAARVQQNKTQQEIARMLGIDFSLISKWETGRLTPSMFWMRKLAELYRVAIRVLFPEVVFGQKNTACEAA